MSPIPELQQRQIDRWCTRRIPADRRSEIGVISRWRGRMVTLVVRRAQWSHSGGPAQGRERPFAQLRYGTDGMWTLYYWSEELGRWRRYPPSLPVNSPVPLLQDIDGSTFFSTHAAW